jgi:hypothetical protein
MHLQKFIYEGPVYEDENMDIIFVHDDRYWHERERIGSRGTG